MTASQRGPNDRLGAVLDEAGVTAVGLAQRMVDVAAEWGLNLHTTHTQVARWRSGQVPRTDTQLVLAEALSRKVGRPLTLHDLGFREEPAPAASDTNLTEDAYQSIDYAVALWRTDVTRQAFIEGSVTSAIISKAALSWLLGTPSGPLARAEGQRISEYDVASIRAATEMFASLDNKFGGHHSRLAAVQYLNHRVAPMLQGSYTEQIGKSLFAATSELTLCVAWMAYDSGHHNLARRYFLQSLSLARHAGERDLGASVLSALSHQENLLGELTDARDLARAARHAARSSGSRTLNAQFASMEARALASLGSRDECLRALGEAEDHFFARNSAEDPSWMSYFDSAELAAEAAHCQLGLGNFASAAATLEQSSGQEAGYARSNAFAGLIHVEALVADGQVEQAAALGGEVLDLCRDVASARIDVYLTNLRERIKPLRTTSALADFSQELGLLRSTRASRPARA